MNYNNFIPYKLSEENEYKYIKGNYKDNIVYSRYDYLHELALMSNGKLKISLRDPKTNYWTKWLPFFVATSNSGIPQNIIEYAFDIHRSLMNNEIVVESDYKEYIDNVEAARLIGKMLEDKGFKPHYYYSGNKSLHIHIFLDYNRFEPILDRLYDLRIKHFRNKDDFYNNFIIWMREQIITCWDLNLKEFDKDLIRSTHLIRSELSKNKKGHKTFLGYTYKELKDEPFICNHVTKNYPSIATTCNTNSEYSFELKYSVPNNLESIVREFLEYYDKIYTIKKIRRKSSLFVGNYAKKGIRKEIKLILEDNFSTTQDGMKRALFILCNELKQIYSNKEAIERIKDWNIRMGEPFKNNEIIYRINNNNKYFLKTSYINEFLKDIGILE